ncbi:hypothetical protein [Rahnella inusitata]|uniref:hypothetical protein n=1 Tax=Rahnella inusitata TaxID=58169 RepID=UPI0039AEB13A
MKYNEDMRFTHPVLGPMTSDYKDAVFELNEIIIEEKRPTWEIDLSGFLYIKQPDIERLISDGEAGCYLYISCGETYYSSYVGINPMNWWVTIPPGLVRGRVLIRPVVNLLHNNVQIPDVNVNDEFGRNISLPHGKPIAIGAASSFNAGYKKLIPMESIFKLIKSKDTKSGSFEINYSGQSVDIYVGVELHKIISDLRVNKITRDILLSSVYLPCIVELLVEMNDDEFSEMRWFQVLKAKCESHGINYKKKSDFLKNAQILLNEPVALLKQSLKGINNYGD